MHTHVKTFLSKSTNEQIWQQLFSSQAPLSIGNILHIAEICIVLPISSADVERVFSSFARILSVKRLSLRNLAIENTLIAASNDFEGFKADRYQSVVDDFLHYHPDGEIRKRAPHLSAHKTHKRQKRVKSAACCRKRNCLFLPDSLLPGSADDRDEAQSDDDSSDYI